MPVCLYTVCYMCAVVSSSSTGSSSLPVATQACEVSASVCPVSAASQLSTAKDSCDMRLPCSSHVDTSVHHMDGTGQTFATANSQKLQMSLSTNQAFAVADPPKSQLSSTRQVFADTDAHQSQPSSSTSLAFPVTGQKSESSLPTGPAAAITDAAISQLSLPPSCLNTFSSVSQLSSTSAVTSSMSEAYNAVKCEPAMAAAAAAASVSRLITCIY